MPFQARSAITNAKTAELPAMMIATLVVESLLFIASCPMA